MEQIAVFIKLNDIRLFIALCCSLFTLFSNQHFFHYTFKFLMKMAIIYTDTFCFYFYFYFCPFYRCNTIVIFCQYQSIILSINKSMSPSLHIDTVFVLICTISAYIFILILHSSLSLSLHVSAVLIGLLDAYLDSGTEDDMRCDETKKRE